MHNGSERIQDILRSWESGRNALLYGPPATGKTRLISELFQALGSPPEAERGILLDPLNADTPFSRPAREIPIPLPAKVIWTTFHQSYGYEDFVLGLRPEIAGGGTVLRPWSGVFLDAALELKDPESKYESVVIFIDEINRGNAARIFGEFMTFLDFDYREEGKVPLPLPLRQLTYSGGISDPLHRIGGKTMRVPDDFKFPRDIYIVATMNSVDRAAVPIDSALARRFDRIEMRPNLSILAEEWGLDRNSIPDPTGEGWKVLNPFETAYLLLERLNILIASDLGPEFELGHGLLTSLSFPGSNPIIFESDAQVAFYWRTLAKIWDDVLFPQLEDRYSGRPEQLMDLLHVDEPPPEGDYAWRLRSLSTGRVIARTLAPVRVSDCEIETIQRSFRWLAQ